MLLDEIDEMVEYIKETYKEMESMYAKYLPYFPIQSGLIDALNQQLNGLQSGESGPRHDREPGKELMNQKDMLSIADDIRRFRESQEIKPDGFTPVDKTSSDRLQYTIRNLFRKINQLCHPDKTKRFNRITVMKLRECFDDAQKAYEQRDYDTLELTFIRVCYYRDELGKLDKNDVKKISDQHNNLKLDIQGIRMHRLYMVLACHSNMHYQEATQHFGLFIQEHLMKLQAVIAGLEEGQEIEDILANERESNHNRAQ